ncbi:oligosaccharide flippase family protein [Shewanella baltica]|uniref:lipopolysaccharide biosynthesis protein n=1 Tax=Shewanella baltica TaxID=62322 RepID=UPI0028715DDD|nr:oligosaccharide flippase family protein [Shewanella baltica]MDR9765631.1 oligosaccharide flippase family protein [Shewanella baltica]
MNKQIIRNFINLLVSGAFVQIIPLLMIPLLTRYYDPLDYTVYSFFIACVVIASPFSSFRLEHLLVRIKDTTNTLEVTKSISMIILFNSVPISFIIFLVFSNFYPSFFRIEMLVIVYISLTSNVIFLLFNSFLAKNGEYSPLAIGRLIKGIGECFLALGYIFIFENIYFGLIIAYTLSSLISILYMWKFSTLKLKVKSNFTLIKPYFKDFLLNDVPAALLNSVILQLPILLLSVLVPGGFSGLYAMANRICSAPSGLLNNSLGMIFRNQAAEELVSQSNFRSSFIKTFTIALVFSLFLLCSLLFIPEYFWGYILGREWSEIGPIILVLAPLAAIRMISFPLSYSFYLAAKLRLNFIFQIFLLPYTFLSIYIPYVLNFSPEYIMQVYVIAMVFFYILYIFILKKLSIITNRSVI